MAGLSEILTRSAVAALAALMFSCAGSAPQPTASASAATSSRHGYALLFELMGQEKNVSKLLVIKRDREDFEALIGEIADVCGAAHAWLEDLGEADPSLALEDTGLPRDEVAVREAIAETRTRILLTENGKEFEIQMLLAQNEALTYALHLAEVLARAEPDPERLAFVRALWQDLQRLQADLIALLRTRYRWSPDGEA